MEPGFPGGFCGFFWGDLEWSGGGGGGRLGNPRNFVSILTAQNNHNKNDRIIYIDIFNYNMYNSTHKIS